MVEDQGLTMSNHIELFLVVLVKSKLENGWKEEKRRVVTLSEATKEKGEKNIKKTVV